MMKFKRFVLSLFCCVCSCSGWAEKSTNGLLFTSSTDSINNRTSLILFDDKPEKFTNSFSISFDLSIWDIAQFGYVLRVVNEKKEEVDFVFVNFYGEDNMYLDFHSPITHKSVPIPISKEDIEQKKWIPVKLHFDLVNDCATIYSKDSLYHCQQIGLKNPSSLKFAFGLYGLNLDVPQMTIRNIEIENNGKVVFSFPLNESSGNEVHDSNEKIRGKVNNPQWLINRHFHWAYLTSFHETSAAEIVYNDSLNWLFVLNQDSIMYYDPDYGKKNVMEISTAPEDTVYRILQQKAKSFPCSALHHYNMFGGENKDDLYIFGGFGNFSYSNILYKYNAKKSCWDTIPLIGDNIMPRFFSASGKGASPSEIFLFGGFGNESGKQEHGGRNLYDFFSIDLTTKEARKIWEIEPSDNEIFVPCGNLIFDKQQSYFYTLCYPHHLANANLSLYKFNVNDGSYEIVSDSVPIVPEKMNTKAYLFYNEKQETFYAITREFVDDNTSKVMIYSLLAPPVTQSQLEVYNGKSASNNTLWVVLSLSVLIVLLLLLFVGRKWLFKRKKQINISINKKGVYDLNKYATVVNVFGSFAVYDRKKQDISYRFSQKLRTLFAFILLHSKDNSGITTEKMSTELWPDKDTNGAKNIRGVTINRLRSILADMDGITLVHQNSQWFFTFEEPFYCDYAESLQLMSQLDTSSVEAYKEQMDKLIFIHKKGGLFPNLKGNWLDDCKRDYENRFESILRNYIDSLEANKSFQDMIAASEVYFLIDPLNEEVMNMVLKAYYRLGKKEQASVFLDKFKRTYKELLGEEYKHI